jgi:ubiquitin-conjugating enzyme E2 M
MNFMSLKKKKADDKAAAAQGRQKHTAGELRMQKDIAELNVADIGEFKLHEEGKLMAFDINVIPKGGLYKGGAFLFTFDVSADYPHKPPSVLCKTKVFHPNIDLEGKVCLNVLREDWKPVLNINTVIYGLYHLFVDPNTEDPLNKEAAQMLASDPDRFSRLVRQTISDGATINGVSFPCCKYMRGR